MKKIIAVYVLLIISVYVCNSLAFALTGNVTRKKMDLGRTLQFLEGWSSRDKWDKFPESPSFAYYNVYSVKALKGAVAPELRNKVVEYIQSCQMRDGGFASSPHHDQVSNTIFTYYALKTLDLLGSIDAVDRKRAADFILSLVRTDGSIMAKADDKTTSLSTTYFGVVSLALLDATTKLDGRKTIAFINAYREPHKGYCMIKGAISMPSSTCMGVKTLMLLGGLTDDVKTEVVGYLKTSRYSGRVQRKKFTTLPAVEDLSYVLETLADLSALDVVDRKNVTDFVESLYIAENGGFGPEPGLGTTPPSTFHAIFCLDKLGRIIHER